MDYIVYPVFRGVHYPNACRILGSAGQPRMRHWVDMSCGRPVTDSEGAAMAIDFVLGRHPTAYGVVLVPKMAEYPVHPASVPDWVLRKYPIFARG